jgi:hypothetical protein
MTPVAPTVLDHFLEKNCQLIQQISARNHSIGEWPFVAADMRSLIVHHGPLNRLERRASNMKTIGASALSSALSALIFRGLS